MQHPGTKGVAETTHEAFEHWKELGWTEAPADAELTSDVLARSDNPNVLSGAVDPKVLAAARAKDEAEARGVTPATAAAASPVRPPVTGQTSTPGS